VTVHRLKSKTERLEDWHVAKKIKPSQRGAIKLARAYGDELLCVRYRENPDGTERLTTVELVVDRTVIQKRDDPIVWFKIRQDELELRHQIMSRGARYDGSKYLWRLSRSEVIRLGLRARIVGIVGDPIKEHVRPQQNLFL
jgi:hypothetical protein